MWQTKHKAFSVEIDNTVKKGQLLPQEIVSVYKNSLC